MNNIEWKDGAVCYAGGWQWFDYQGDTLIDNIKTIDGAHTSLHCNAIKEQDFQLNEPRIGDYIPKSELDTEQKYNDAIEVFEILGVHNGKRYSYYAFKLSELIKVCDFGIALDTNLTAFCKRKITYAQLMAIGKLKRLMNERDKVNDSEEPNGCEKPKLATQYLNECIEVQKQRGEQYDSTGTGERSFAAAASAFNALTGQNLKGSDVCLLLTCVKAVRQYSNPNRLHEDSLLDGVSYLSLWAEELNKEIN